MPETVDPWERVAADITGRLTAPGPKWEHVAASIAAAIDAGHLPPGTKLPSRNSLAPTLGVDPATVTRAFTVLKFTGRVRGEQGRGVYVVGPPGH